MTWFHGVKLTLRFGSLDLSSWGMEKIMKTSLQNPNTAPTLDVNDDPNDDGTDFDSQ